MLVSKMTHFQLSNTVCKIFGAKCHLYVMNFNYIFYTLHYLISNKFRRFFKLQEDVKVKMTPLISMKKTGKFLRAYSGKKSCRILM